MRELGRTANSSATLYGTVASHDGRGSIFPSHAWYFDDKRVKTVGQVGDVSFPVTRVGPLPIAQIRRMPGPFAAHLRALPPPALTIATGSLKIYPVLRRGHPTGARSSP